MQCNRPYDVSSVTSTVPSPAAEIRTPLPRHVRAGTGEAEPAGVPEQVEEPGPGMPPERVTQLAEAASGPEAAEMSGSPNAERDDESSSPGANFPPGCAVCPPPTSRKHRSPKCGVCSTANGFPPYGIKAICGRRPRMEDAYKAVPFLMDVVVPGFFSDILPPRIANHVKNQVKSANNSPESESGSDNEEAPAARHLAPYTETLHFFGVFDGHGGAEAALHCAQTLHQRIREALVAAPAAAAAAGPQNGVAEDLPRTSSSPHPVAPVSSDIGVGAALALSIAEHLSQEVPHPHFEAQVSTEPAKEVRLSADLGPACSAPSQSAAQDRSVGVASGPETPSPTADRGSMDMAPLRDSPGPASGEKPEAATLLPDLPALPPGRRSGRASVALTGERRSAFADAGLASSGDVSGAPGPRVQHGDGACQSQSVGLLPSHEEPVLASEQASKGAATGLAHGDAALQGGSAAPHPGVHGADGGSKPALDGQGAQLPSAAPQETLLGARTGDAMPPDAPSPEFEASGRSSEECTVPSVPASAAVVGCEGGSAAHPLNTDISAKATEPRALGGDVPGRKVHLLLNGSRGLGTSPDIAGQGQELLAAGGEGSDGESPKSEDGDVALQDSSSEESPSAAETAEDGQWTFTAEKFEIAFLEAFCRTDEEFAKADNAALVGTTAVVALVGTRQLYVANCGDSRAVLCRGGTGVALTDDHKAAREDETARVEAAGGQILFWNGVRVMGVLAVSRAIGDHCLRPFVIARPEVTILARRPDDELLLLASDGLWDVLSNQEACTLAKRCLRRARQRGASRESAARIAATVLTRAAVDRGSRDNVTVVVVDLSSGTTETEGFVGHPSSSDASIDPADEAVPGTLDSLPDGPSICNPRRPSSMNNTDGAREVHGRAQADKLPDAASAEKLLEEEPMDKPNGPESSRGDTVPVSSLPRKPLEGAVAGTLSRDSMADAWPRRAHRGHDNVPPVEGCETPEASLVERCQGVGAPNELPRQVSAGEAPGGAGKLPEDQLVQNAAKQLASLGLEGPPVGPGAAQLDTFGPPDAKDSCMAAPMQTLSPGACGADDVSGCSSVEDDPRGPSMDRLPTGHLIADQPGQHDLPDVGPAHDLPQGGPAATPSRTPRGDTTDADSTTEEAPLGPPHNMNNMPAASSMVALPVSGGLESFGAVAG